MNDGAFAHAIVQNKWSDGLKAMELFCISQVPFCDVMVVSHPGAFRHGSKLLNYIRTAIVTY